MLLFIKTFLIEITIGNKVLDVKRGSSEESRLALILGAGAKMKCFAL